MNLNSIYQNLNEIESSNKELYLKVDFEKSNLSIIEKQEESSSLKCIGSLFQNMIIQQNPSSDKIAFLQCSFTAIKENKNIDQKIKTFKSIFSNPEEFPRDNPYYQSLLAEKEDSFQVEEKLQKLFEKKQKKEITENSDTTFLFPEKKTFILEKLKTDLSLSEQSIFKTLSMMGERTIVKVKILLDQIVENSDPKVYRKLKLRMLGGVRFSANAQKACYNIFDSPRITAQKIQEKIIIEKTKTRTNVARMYGIQQIPQIDVNSLICESAILNESSLTIALISEITFYLSNPLKILNDINHSIYIYNWEPEKLDDLYGGLQEFKKIILVGLDYFLNECHQRLNDLDVENEEFIQTWKKCISKNEIIASKIKKKFKENNLEQNDDVFIRLLIELKPVPGTLNEENLSFIEMILRETIFEVAELAKEQKLKKNAGISILYQTLLEKLMKYEPGSDKEFLSLIKATMYHFFNKCPRTHYLLNVFFS